MRHSLALMGIALAALVVALLPANAAAQGGDEIMIVHTPPTGVAPGEQIYLTAVFTNATSASIAWQNSSMEVDALVPMTNLSRAEGGGWVYAGYVPAQPSPTQVRYAINATGPSGSRVEGYFLSVDVPTALGITDEQQQAWMLTMAASLSMAASVVAVMYWYTGRRLRRGA